MDNIINYGKPGEVVLSWTDDQNDPQYEISKECEEILMRSTDAKGRHFKIHKLRGPSPVFITDEESKGVDAINGTLPRQGGDRLAASYVNYYTANEGIVFPLFNDPKDEEEQRLLELLYPERKIIGVYAREILLGGGNIHCITQLVPQRTVLHNKEDKIR